METYKNVFHVFGSIEEKKKNKHMIFDTDVTCIHRKKNAIFTDIN